MATEKTIIGTELNGPDHCHVFVSRRSVHHAVFGKDTQIRLRLLAFGANRLSFWDMSDIVPGKDWREQIDENLQKAKILLLVLTRSARRDFAWPLYEAGRYSGLAQTKPGRTVCLYPAGESMPSALKHLQGVPAEKKQVTSLLLKLYKDSNFTHTRTPINELVSHEDLGRIANDICNAINGSFVDEVKGIEYVNPYIKVMLDSDICNPKIVSDENFFRSSFCTAKILSNHNSMKSMFALAAGDSDSKWTWKDLEARTKLDNDAAEFNSNWMREVEAIVRNYILGEYPDTQIESGYLAKEDGVWQPEIEKIYTYTTGRITLDVTFSPSPHRTWMRNVSESMIGSGLAANIMIGSRIRQEVIQESAPLLEKWEGGSRPTDAEVDRLKRRINSVQRDGFFISTLTSNSIHHDFELEDRRALSILEVNFRDDIGEPLQKALAKKDVAGIRFALDEWNSNNAKFLTIALRRYAEIFGVSQSSTEISK